MALSKDRKDDEDSVLWPGDQEEIKRMLCLEPGEETEPSEGRSSVCPDVVQEDLSAQEPVSVKTSSAASIQGLAGGGWAWIEKDFCAELECAAYPEYCAGHRKFDCNI